MDIRSRALARLLLCGGLCLAVMPAWASVPQEKTLPATTLAFARIPNAQTFRDALKESRFGRLLNDPAMKPLIEDSQARLKERSERLKQRLGITFRQFWELPQGELSLAIIPAEDARMPYCVVLTADAGDNAKAMTDLLTKATQQAASNNDKVTTEKLANLSLRVIKPGNLNPERAQPYVAWTHVGTVFYVAMAPKVEAIRDALGHLGGRSDSLADTPAYIATNKRLEKNAPMTWFVNTNQVLKLATHFAGQQGMDQETVAEQFKLLGLTGIRSIGGTYAMNVGEFDTVTKTFVYAPGPLAGLLRIFTKFPKNQLRPEPWVPATVASYRSINFDFDNSFLALNDFADQLVPGLLQNLQEQLVPPGANKSGGFDFQRDLFKPLGNRITIISDFKKPITENSQRNLLAIAVDDPKAVQASLNKLIELAELNTRKRDFQGTTIYDIELPAVDNAAPAAAAAAAAASPQGPFSYAIAKNTLFISQEPTLLEQILRPGAPALADSPAFQSVVKHLPAQSTSVMYQRADEQARVIYDMLKTGQFQQALDAANPGGEGLKVTSYFDPIKLPDFAVIAKYMLPGGGFATTDEEGAIITQFALRNANP